MATMKKNPGVENPVDKSEKKMFDFAFGRENYILMIAGIVLLGIGYLLMVGGGSKDPEVFSYEL
ncbi:MAG: DUF3098 domain-containing protein, partial [Bacteroidales bacterium]|nr:DUF3098 domain-containing protein [Bacteroidales bacterium]